MLGGTVPTLGGFHTGFEWGDRWGCECIQIYITLSRRWKVVKLSEDEIKKFKKAWKESSVKQVVAHVPYLVNLASSDDILWKKSIDRLQIELHRADQLGVSLLALHPGSYGLAKREEGIDKIILALDKLLKGYNGKAKILLETMAGQGTMLGSSFEELAFILDRIKSKSVGVCFDVGHIFMAGYDVRGHDGYNRVMDEFDRIIGIKKIKAIHLNDPKTELGSHIDRHNNIGKGKLGLATFQALMKDKRFKDIPKLLEIPEQNTKTKSTIELLQALFEGDKTS